MRVVEKHSLSSLKLENKSYHNYQSMLFGTPDAPLSDKSFMSCICGYLWNTFSKVQQLTGEYFAEKGSRPIMKTENIHPTYDLFMKDILKKFKYFHQQCEEVWIQQVEGKL
ncbi:hypothetical protein L9F63_021771 [Diploptera punctata]|uniref:Uncharacterized protein n=1 Tax=Diploptera punctata TaxID=6984 RepID=A0AAD7ZN79_DIPPU|nr:hypothetical protein L9F63_021771 [Diploptera punctata]